MTHIISDAVKEAFIEVDEEAPGGWHGWRMWSEMLRDGDTLVPDSMAGAEMCNRSVASGFNARNSASVNVTQDNVQTDQRGLM